MQPSTIVLLDVLLLDVVSVLLRPQGKKTLNLPDPPGAPRVVRKPPRRPRKPPRQGPRKVELFRKFGVDISNFLYDFSLFTRKKSLSHAHIEQP